MPATTPSPHDATDAQAGRCWECGYPLRGLPENRCPECGRAFDPADPATTNTAGRIGTVARWLMRPPGAPTYVLTAAAVLISVWAAAVPTRRGAFADLITNTVVQYRRGWAFDWIGRNWMNFEQPAGRFLFGAALWLTVGVVWVARRAARGVAVRRASGQRAATFAYWRRWLVAPVAFGLTVWLCTTMLPIYAGFWVSKPALERAVAEARHAEDGAVQARAIGIYAPYPVGATQVQRWTSRGETRVTINNAALLIHRDDGEPPDPANASSWSVRRLSRHWFLVGRGLEF